MASCDDSDFPLLGDDDHSNSNHHSLHHHILPQSYASLHAQLQPPPAPSSILPPSVAAAGSIDLGSSEGGEQELEEEEEEDDDEEDDEEEEENDTVSGFPDSNPFAGSSNPYNNSHEQHVQTTMEKRRDRDDSIINNGNNFHGAYSFKRAKASINEFRKDREEWSDLAIGCLLEVYTEKFNQLNRGNLRGRDWEEVAAVVSQRCDKQSKTVEQCKNKVDNLKKRYKLERHRMINGGVPVSHWPWFKRMEEIVENSLSMKAAAAICVVNDEDKGNDGNGGASGSAARQSKRYTATTTMIPFGQMNSMKSKPMPNIRWRRVVLKISGVALAGAGPNNIDAKVMALIAREVAMACRLGVEVAIIVGGRNFFCGDTWVTATGSDRCSAYQIGMMASVMNSILLQSSLEKVGVQTRLQTMFSLQEVAETYNRRRAIRHLEKGRVVIFGGIGARAGNPLFSTDTAAAFQASEINAEALLKGTNVDGVYDCHSRDSNVTFEHISFRDLVARGATSMDMMAMTCCEENGIPVVVFNLLEPGNISKALCGEQVGTLIDHTGGIN